MQTILQVSDYIFIVLFVEREFKNSHMYPLYITPPIIYTPGWLTRSTLYNSTQREDVQCPIRYRLFQLLD